VEETTTERSRNFKESPALSLSPESRDDRRNKKWAEEKRGIRTEVDVQ
jgi:hypothetical protein